MKILIGSVINELPDLSTVFLDSNEIVTALNHPEFNTSVIEKIKEAGQALATIPEVFLEFVRGSSSVDQYNTRKAFIENLVDGNFPPVPKIEKDLISYMLILHKKCQGMQLTDLLLGVALCKYPNSFLLTQNHKHFLLSVFERVRLITTDIGALINNHALYKIKTEKMTELIQGLA